MHQIKPTVIYRPWHGLLTSHLFLLIQLSRLRLGAGTRTAFPRLPHGAPARGRVAAACPWGSPTPTSNVSWSKSPASATCGPARWTSPNTSRYDLMVTSEAVQPGVTSGTNANVFLLLQPGKKCLNIYREDQPSNLTISGCTSKKPYRPKYCGVCTDERCCIPYKSKTIDVEFECPNGTGFTWKMLWVQACFCNLSCKNPNDIFAELESYYGYPEVMNWRSQLKDVWTYLHLLFSHAVFCVCNVSDGGKGFSCALFFLLEKSVNMKYIYIYMRLQKRIHKAWCALQMKIFSHWVCEILKA